LSSTEMKSRFNVKQKPKGMMCAYEATSRLPSLLPIFAPNNIVHILLYILLQTKVGGDHKNLLRIPHSSKTTKCISQQKKQNSKGNRGNLGKLPIAGGFSTLLVISNWEISIWGYSRLHRYVLSSIRFHRDSLSPNTQKCTYATLEGELHCMYWSSKVS
jgi:hypothetical protein